MSYEQKLEQIRQRVECTMCATFSSDGGDIGEIGHISRHDFDTLILAALSAPKAEAVEPVDYQWREGRSTRHAPDEWDWGPWHAGRLPAHVENREYLRYEERALYTSPAPALIDEAERFESADWFFRTMDPDDSGDNPAEAIHSGMIGHFVVCEIASSFNGPTRYGFSAPVLDPENDDEEFLHFASEDEAIAAARTRAAFPSTGGDNGQA